MTEDHHPDLEGEDPPHDPAPHQPEDQIEDEADAIPPKRFRAATDEELDPQSFIVADDRAALRAVLRGGSIETDRGDAEFIGNAVRRLARTLHETANRYRHGTGAISIPLLRRVEFGHSVEIDLEIGNDEDVQLDTAGRPRSPTIDAASALIDLFAAEPDDLLARALDFPSDAVAEYRQFLNLLAGDNVTLEWQSPLRPEQVVQYSSVDARRDFAILDRPGEPRTDVVHVPGTLTMADSRRHRFELSLPSDLNRPPLLKGKQTVQGAYSEEMGHHLKDEGLWDSEVMATIEVTYDAPGSTPLPRDPEYTLVAAEPLMRTSPMFE
jgi:hypothetical protein